MGKRKWLFALMLAILLGGCGKQSDIEKDNGLNEEIQVEQQNTSEEKEETQKQPEDQNAQSNDPIAEEESKVVNLYYIDEQTGEYTSRQIQIAVPEDIWKELQNTPVLTEECKLLQCRIDESSGRIELDINHATGEWIRSMGTQGEQEILACVVNSYLEAYDCSGVKITEEGNALSTSHAAELNGYIEYMKIG